jgi:hypothetical protein
MPSTAKQKFKCAYCLRSFPRPASLGSHVYRVHPEHRKATAAPVNPAQKKAPVTIGRHVRAEVGPKKRGLARARPAPAPLAETESQRFAFAPASTDSNSALTHLYAAISDLEKEVETDRRDLARLEALQRGIAKKQELLAALIKERGKFVGQE